MSLKSAIGNNPFVRCYRDLRKQRIEKENMKLSDKDYLNMKFNRAFGRDIDWDNPKSFNEKLQWLKVYYRNPLYTKLVDKYDVKRYIANIIGEQYVIPTLGVWDSFDEIDFDALPDSFVLKCTHDSGGLVIVKDKSKLNRRAARKTIESSLKRNFYYQSREWPYKNVKPRIIAEQYMEDAASTDLRDYKFMCFNGKVKSSFVCSDRYSEESLKVTFFDIDWNKMPFTRDHPMAQYDIERPVNYQLMIEICEKLSKEFPFVRVDLYEINNKVYFGELTFFPGGGFERFQPEEWDYKFGEWLTLPEKMTDIKD